MDDIFDFLTFENARQFVNQKMNVELDMTSFLAICLKSKIWIHHEALTDFTAIKGFSITDYEIDELAKHKDFVNKFRAPDDVDDSIYGVGSFEYNRDKIVDRIKEEINEKIKINATGSIKNQYDLEWRLNKASIDEKLKDMYSEIERRLITNREAENKLEEDLDYIELLKRKPYLERLYMICNASLIQKIKDTTYAFSAENLQNLEAGFYEFLDQNLTGETRLLREISPNSHDYSWNSLCENILELNGEYFYKYHGEFSNSYPFESTDKGRTRIKPEKGILHQGFLTKDLLKLIEKPKKIQKNTKEELHFRTANNASKIISALCELKGLDITQPFGESGKLIMSELDKLGTPLSKDVVGYWLKLAHENTK